MRLNRSYTKYWIYVSFAIVALIIFASVASAQKKNSCIECHVKLEDPRLSAPAKLFDNDIHKARGLFCNDCHGGDPNADSKESAKDPSKGYLGKPKTLDIRRTAASATATRT